MSNCLLITLVFEIKKEKPKLLLEFLLFYVTQRLLRTGIHNQHLVILVLTFEGVISLAVADDVLTLRDSWVALAELSECLPVL